MRKVKLLFLILMLLLVNVISALPFGTLGNIDVPDGFVSPANRIQVNFASYLRDGKVDFNDENADYEYNYVIQARYGLFDRADIGFVYTGDEVFYANLKFKLIEENDEYPGICIGVDNLFSKVDTDYKKQLEEHPEELEDIQDADTYERNSFYVTASKAWAFTGVPVFDEMQTYVTLGMGVNRFVGQRDLAKDFNGLFGSVEFRPNDSYSFFTEQSGHAINIGARYSWNNFDFQYSILEIEEFIKENDDNLKMALNINFNINNWVKEDTGKRFDNRTGARSVGRRTSEFKDSQLRGQSILDRINALKQQEQSLDKANDVDTIVDEEDIDDLINEMIEE